MQPEPSPLVLSEGSAREQLEHYLDRVLRGKDAPRVKRRILELADRNAAQMIELYARPDDRWAPVPGEKTSARGERL